MLNELKNIILFNKVIDIILYDGDEISTPDFYSIFYN